MELDLRALLENLPPDEKNRVKAFLTRLDAEEESPELIADISDYLQSRVDDALDALGAPKVSDDDPALAEARKEAVEATQAALDKFQATMGDLDGQVGDLQKSVGSELDAVEAEDLKKKISDVG